MVMFAPGDLDRFASGVLESNGLSDAFKPNALGEVTEVGTSTASHSAAIATVSGTKLQGRNF